MIGCRHVENIGVVDDRFDRNGVVFGRNPLGGGSRDVAPHDHMAGEFHLDVMKIYHVLF